MSWKFVAVGITVVGAVTLGYCYTSFVTFNARSAQAPAKLDLKEIYDAERAYFAKHGAYTEKAAELGWTPPKYSRYSFHFAAGQVVPLPGGSTPCVPPRAAPPVEVGIIGNCPACEITVAAVGNIDCDPAVDVWMISTATRLDAHGTRVDEGTPWNVQNDAVFAHQP